jgi:hypothetical protein
MLEPCKQRVSLRCPLILQPSYSTIIECAADGPPLKVSIMSELAIQEYVKQFPGFSVPSFQTIGRYFRSFFQNFKFPVIHAHCIQSDCVSVALRLAMLALGARYLFEFQSASALFNATRSLVTKHWTSSQQDVSLCVDGYVGVEAICQSIHRNHSSSILDPLIS